MGELAIMTGAGDTKMTWDPANEFETEQARRSFDEHRKKGYLAYRVIDADGTKGEQITTFDARAGKIILAPPMRGG